MTEAHWIAQLLADCEKDVAGYASEEEFRRAANEVQAMADKNERLEAALRRTLSWLSSYPGGGAIGAWEQAHDALEPLSLGAVPKGHSGEI